MVGQLVGYYKIRYLRGKIDGAILQKISYTHLWKSQRFHVLSVLHAVEF